jgi:hypothetical protein
VRNTTARSTGAGVAVVIVVTLFVILTLAMSPSGAASSAASAGANAVVPSAPRDVSVVPGVGQLRVTWRPPLGERHLALRYVVRSIPAGRSCTTEKTGCTFRHVDNATPWRFSVAASTPAGEGPASALTGSPPHLTVLVVAGQSNVVGIDAYAVDPWSGRNVLSAWSVHHAARHTMIVWRESGVVDAGLPPVLLSTPQILSGVQSPIFGPEMGLVAGLYADGRHNLLIVKVGFVGTSLAEDWATSGILYQTLVTTTQDALAWGASNGYSATVGGVYWLQGETDAEHLKMANAYASNLTAFIASLRANLSLSSTTPFVLGEIDIAKFVEFREAHGRCIPSVCREELKGNRVVRAAELEVSATVPDTYLVDTSTLPRYPRVFLHLTNYGELRLGEAFAAASVHHLT